MGQLSLYERCAKANPKIVDDFGASELTELSKKLFTAINLGIPPSKDDPTTPEPAEDPETPEKPREKQSSRKKNKSKSKSNNSSSSSNNNTTPDRKEKADTTTQEPK